MRNVLIGVLTTLLFFPVFTKAQFSYKYNSSIGGTSNLIADFLFDVDSEGMVYALETREEFLSFLEYYQIKRFDSNNQLIDSIRLTFGGLPVSSILPEILAFKRASNGNYYLLTKYASAGASILYAFSAKGSLLFNYNLNERQELLELYQRLSSVRATQMLIDDKDHIRLLAGDHVISYSLDGEFAGYWKTGKLSDTVTMAVDDQGNSYIAGADNSIVVFNSIGQEIRTIPLSTTRNIKHLFSDDAAQLFIVYDSPYNTYVVVYDINTGRVDSITTHQVDNSSAEVAFRNISQVVSKNKKLYVADLRLPANLGMRVADFSHDRLAIFSRSGLSGLTIYGPGLIPVNTPVTYRLLPKNEDRYYSCRYTGQNVSRVAGFDSYSGNADHTTITLIAAEEATPGRLVCYYYEANEEDSASIYITPYKPAKPYSLIPVVCDAEEYTFCDGVAIKSFQFNDLNKTGLSCDVLSYKDFTLDSVFATVNMGRLYSATVSLSAGNFNQPYYAGIWIDLNNDGDFEDEEEFSGTAIAFDGIVKFTNIQIPQSATYKAHVRMRVRSRAITPFAANESCIRVGDQGETQDYSVHITQSVTLAASEAVTPNNDGKNDYFVIKGVDPDYANTLVITDTYGKIIKETNDYANDWPGKNDLDNLKKGTYYYFFKNGPSFINGFFVVNY